MILASMHISRRCEEMMSFNESIIHWRYLLIVRFLHLSHMLSHYVQLHAPLFGSMGALLHAYLVGSEHPSTCTAFMCARTQQWI